MLNVRKLIESVEACMGWPYVSPGTNDARGIDCSGLLVKAFRDQGGSIYHGSNTIWRKYCSDKGMLTSVSQLKPGMAVFKWNANTPDKFSDGQGDFQHVGIVTSVNPLRIVHASSAVGCVTADTTLGKWTYWGWLKDVENTESATADGGSPVKTSAPASQDASAAAKVRIVSAGGNVNIRHGNGLAYSRIAAARPGTELEYVATAVNGWHAVKYGKLVGWVSPEYSEIV